MAKAANAAARTTPPVRISFPSIFELRSYQGGKPSKSLRIMYDKTNKEHVAFLKLLNEDYKKVLAEQWPDPATRPRVKVMGDPKSPIKDGDTACNGQGIPYKEKYPELAGHYFMNVARYPNEYDPEANLTIVDRNMSAVINRGVIYSGCYCKVNINAYARTNPKNLGGSFGLNGVQKWAEGDRLSGGAPDASSMFEAAGGQDDPGNYGGGDPFSGGGTADGYQNDVYDQATGTDDDIPF